MESITVTNCGPVPNLVVPIQPGGTVIRGYCGKGKSIVLEAIALGLGAREKGRVAPRNGTKRGEVDCLGVVLGINASRITRNGDSTVASIEEFSIGDLIDPPVKDDDARNRHGIKALLRLSGAEADPQLFHHLAGGKEEFERLIAPEAIKTNDLVDMAVKVKRAFETRAQAAEAEAEKEEAKAAADRNAGDGLDLAAETDAAKLQQRLEDAAGLKSAMDEQAKAARKALSDAAEAREKLAAATGQAESIAELEAAHLAAIKAENDASDEVILLGRQLQDAKNRLTVATVALQSQERALNAAKRNLQLTAGWQAAIDAAANVTCPSDDDLELAGDCVVAARRAIETAAVVRAAKERIERAAAHQKAASEFRKTAMRLREAARGTNDVLSAAVASRRYSVDGGVLCGTLPDGEVRPYYDLSDGQRTMIAVAEKIERARAVEPDGKKLALVDLPQRVYQDLPPSVRRALFALAESRNCCVVTAEVDDGELRAEVFEPETEAAGATA